MEFVDWVSVLAITSLTIAIGGLIISLMSLHGRLDKLETFIKKDLGRHYPILRSEREYVSLETKSPKELERWFQELKDRVNN